MLGLKDSIFVRTEKRVEMSEGLKVGMGHRTSRDLMNRQRLHSQGQHLSLVFDPPIRIQLTIINSTFP